MKDRADIEFKTELIKAPEGDWKLWNTVPTSPTLIEITWAKMKIKKAPKDDVKPNFNKTLFLLGFTFQSSSERTPQYLEFHRTFKREMINVLKEYTKRIEIQKPNHFDVYGFLETKNGDVFYFSLGDLRWDKDNLLIRTAKDFNDYTGGTNNFIPMDNRLKENLIKMLK